MRLRREAAARWRAFVSAGVAIARWRAFVSAGVAIARRQQEQRNA